VVNVAPARHSAASLARQIWARPAVVVEAHLLTLVHVCCLVGGSLGDLKGRRRIFMIGPCAGLAGVCSLLCALAPSSRLLIAARAVQVHPPERCSCPARWR